MEEVEKHMIEEVRNVMHKVLKLAPLNKENQKHVNKLIAALHELVNKKIDSELQEFILIAVEFIELCKLEKPTPRVSEIIQILGGLSDKGSSEKATRH
jgi:hypothetical protein